MHWNKYIMMAHTQCHWQIHMLLWCPSIWWFFFQTSAQRWTQAYPSLQNKILANANHGGQKCKIHVLLVNHVLAGNHALPLWDVQGCRLWWKAIAAIDSALHWISLPLHHCPFPLRGECNHHGYCSWTICLCQPACGPSVSGAYLNCLQQTSFMICRQAVPLFILTRVFVWEALCARFAFLSLHTCGKMVVRVSLSGPIFPMMTEDQVLSEPSSTLEIV